MNTELKRKMIAGLRKTISEQAHHQIVSDSKLGNEIEYFLGVQVESDQVSDVVDAVFQVETFAEENRDRQMLTLVRQMLIAAGYYVPMDASEIARSFTTRGTVWNFKLDGVAYRHAVPASFLVD